MDDRTRSAVRRGVGVAAVALPLALVVAVLSWRGTADPANGLALAALGVGLLAFGRWVRRTGWTR